VTEVQVKQNQVRKGFLRTERFFKVTLGGTDMSAARSRGSRGFRPELWVPTPEDFFQFVVEDLGPRLQQEMCSTKGPLHLLLLDEPPADYLVDRRLNEGCADPFSLSPSLAKVWNEVGVVLDVHPR
jgi:hypothetical protein